MESVVYEKISSLEAMSLIDQNKTDNLYFVEIYCESNYPYGSNGKSIHHMTPNDIRQTDPIKYKSLVIIKTGKILFPFKEIEAEPGKIIFEKLNRKYSGHRWLLKKQCLDVMPKPPLLKR